MGFQMLDRLLAFFNWGQYRHSDRNINVGETHKKSTWKATFRQQKKAALTFFPAAAGLVRTQTSRQFEVALLPTTSWFVFDYCTCKGPNKTHRIQ